LSALAWRFLSPNKFPATAKVPGAVLALLYTNRFDCSSLRRVPFIDVPALKRSRNELSKYSSDNA